VTAPPRRLPPPLPPPSAPVAQSTVVIEAQAASVASTSLAAQSAAVTYVLAAGGEDEEAWYNTDSLRAIIRGTATVVDAFSAREARQTDDFIADSIANLTGKPYRAIGIRKVTGIHLQLGVRKGATTADVISRAADRYRYQQSLLDKQFVADVKAGASTPTELAAPLDVALDRVKRATQMNLALASRNQAVATMADAADRELIIGYRRVLHAELSKTGDCGLCVADSTRIYHSSHLMALHPGCHCIPVPVSATHDPGAIINDRDLGRFYADAGGTSAQKLRETRYKVDEHGEIGPVLRPFGDPIRTHEQAKADTSRRRPKTAEQRIRTLRNRRDALASAYQQASAGQTDPAWRDRLDGVAARIARLDAEIVKQGG